MCNSCLACPFPSCALQSSLLQGRYSYIGAQPSIEIIATGSEVRIEDRERETTSHESSEDPIGIPAEMSATYRVVNDPGLPKVFTGGWVGYSGYDTVRYVYSGKHVQIQLCHEWVSRRVVA